MLDAQPAFGPSDARMPGLVDDLRAELPAGTEVTGTTPLFADITELLAHRLWLVIAFVVGVSVLLLAMVFRSVAVPIKAAAMNLLSIGAAYGVLVAVFQWGWGVRPARARPRGAGVQLGPDPDLRDPVRAVDGLRGVPAVAGARALAGQRRRPRSVVRGLSSTGRVISAAAAIMVAVFLGFATEVDVTVKMLGLGMATAIALDATVVRMVLVPATMALLGRWNWWLPGWLDRILPGVSVEGGAEAEPGGRTPSPTVGRADPAERTPSRV